MLQDKLQNDLKQAQLDRNETRVSTLRLLLSEVHNVQIQQGVDPSDQAIILVIQKEAKKRKEAAAGFRQGDREEQAQREEAELKVLEGYLPQQLSNEVLTSIIEDTITELEAKGLINEVGANSLADMGKVMGSVMSKVKGQADGNVVSGIVKERLTT